MAAGLGYIEFATGDILTAAAANGYLASQTVMVFANAAARTAAITSPQEGMFSYLKDSNSTQYYSGSAWVSIGGASPLTTKGDLYAYSTTDARLPVGTNGQILTADSTAATGLAWATPASGSMTLLSTTSLTGAYTLISSISQSYKNLYIEVSGVTAAAAGRFRMWPNDTTTTNGNTSQSSFENTGSTKDENNYALTAGFNTNLSASDTTNCFAITWYNYASTTERKPFIMTGRFIDGSATYRNQLAWGAFKNTTAISGFRVDNDNGNLTAGTVRIYGVN